MDSPSCALDLVVLGSEEYKHHSGHYEREELQVHVATAPAAHRARFSRMHFKRGIDMPWSVVAYLV